MFRLTYERKRIGKPRPKELINIFAPISFIFPDKFFYPKQEKRKRKEKNQKKRIKKREEYIFKYRFILIYYYDRIGNNNNINIKIYKHIIYYSFVYIY